MSHVEPKCENEVVVSDNGVDASRTIGCEENGPPDGGYGWICLICIFFIQMCTWGVVSTFGVFLAYYLSHDAFPTATSLDYALIGGLQLSVCMLSTVPVNYLSGRFGPRIPMYVGCIIQSGGFLGISFAQDHVYELYLGYIAIGLGIGFLYLPAINVLSQWFDSKISIANGIGGAGCGVGGIAFSFAAKAAISSVGIGWTLRMLCIVTAVVNTLATTFIRSRDKEIEARYHPFNWRLLRRKGVPLLLTWTFVYQLGYVVVYYSLPDFATTIGLNDSQGATVNAILNVGLAFGRLLLGYLGDRFGSVQVAGWGTFANAVMIFAIWLPAKSYGVIILFALLNGSINGLFWSMIGPLCGAICDLREVPEVLSLCWVATLLPLTFSEVIALKIRKGDGSTDQYLYAQIFAGAGYLCASLFLLLLWISRRKAKH